MPVIVSKYLVPEGFNGITLYPFIFLKEAALKKDRIMLNHERIHLRQQLELLVIPFYIWYLTEFFLGRIRGYSKTEAYRNISFEREAYSNEYDMTYLTRRKFWAFVFYIFKSESK